MITLVSIQPWYPVVYNHYICFALSVRVEPEFRNDVSQTHPHAVKKPRTKKHYSGHGESLKDVDLQMFRPNLTALISTADTKAV